MDTELDDIIGNIYNAAAGRADWRAVLGRIAGLIDAWYMGIGGLSKKDGALTFYHFGGVKEVEGELEYVRKYNQIDPRTQRLLMTCDTTQWLHCHEHFDEEFVANDPFYQEFLIPIGGRYISETKILEDEARVVIFAAMRGVDQQPFDTKEREVLQSIKTHLTRAMEIYHDVRLALSELPVGTQLLEQFQYPMFLIDEQRSIRFHNRAAEPMLAAGEYVVDRAGALVCRKPEDDYDLAEAIKALNLHGQEPGAERRILKPRRLHDGPIAVYVNALRPQAVMSAFGPTPLILLIFHDPSMHTEVDPFIVAETFDLTPAEARVAVHIAGGGTPEEIAARSGVSIATVRCQLQAVFQKTGMNRQSDLVRVVAGLALPGMLPAEATSRVLSNRHKN